jgi:hypothetical protein
MGVPKQSTRTTATTSAGAWTKVFSTPTADRTGIGIFITPGSANNAFIRFLPLGSSAPAGVTEGFADAILFKTDTITFNEEARSDVDVWVCGGDGTGAACTYNAWEVIG